MSTAASEEPLLRTEPQPSQNRDDASPRPEKGRFDRFQLLLVLLIQVGALFCCAGCIEAAAEQSLASRSGAYNGYGNLPIRESVCQGNWDH